MSGRSTARFSPRERCSGRRAKTRRRSHRVLTLGTLVVGLVDLVGLDRGWHSGRPPREQSPVMLAICVVVAARVAGVVAVTVLSLPWIAFSDGAVLGLLGGAAAALLYLWWRWRS